MFQNGLDRKDAIFVTVPPFKSFQETRGSCCTPFAFREKQKYQVSNVRMKSKIVTFATQRIIEFKQFLTRPKLACSVAKNDRRFFSVLIFHEIISN